MASLKLAIASESTITVWDTAAPDTHFSFTPADGIPVADIAWNHNAHVLASCSAVEPTVLPHASVTLTAATTGKLLDSINHSQGWKRPGGATTSVVFGGKSRYLCIGDSSGAVCLWDLKKRMRVRQFFHDDHPCRQVALDALDRFVISLSDCLISVYSLREGKMHVSFTPSGNFTFTSFGTSRLQPQLIAVGTTDGSILLFDITHDRNTESQNTVFCCHASAVTKVAISPQNAHLVASASLDGTLKFISIDTGETIHQLASLGCAISSLELHDDGVSCAIGTKTGDVHLYDIRHDEALDSLRVGGSVSSVRFAPTPKKKENTADTVSPFRKVVKAPLHANISRTVETTENNPNAANNETQDEHGISRDPSLSPLEARQRKGRLLIPSDSTRQTNDTSPRHRSSPGETQVQELPTMPSREQGDRNALITMLSQEREAMSVMQSDISTLTDIVREELDSLRDDMEESVRNLHMDMISQFHRQSEEMNAAFERQLEAIQMLSEENSRLRQENNFLKQEYRS